MRSIRFSENILATSIMNNTHLVLVIILIILIFILFGMCVATILQVCSIFYNRKSTPKWKNSRYYPFLTYKSNSKRQYFVSDTENNNFKENPRRLIATKKAKAVKYMVSHGTFLFRRSLLCVIKGILYVLDLCH